MSYWKNYRLKTAALNVLAESSEDETEVVEAVVENDKSDLQDTDSSDIEELDSVDSISDEGLCNVVSSDSETESDSEENTSNLRESLASWASKHNQSKYCIDELLNILGPHFNDLPKDSRTLLRTPKTIDVIEKCGGKYINFTLKQGIMNILSHKSQNFPDNILMLNFNIDGIPLFKSTGTQFWPILCSLENYTPFIVSIYYGNAKPNSIEEYLEDFVTELNELQEVGLLFEDRTFTVKVNAFICDAPARAFLKNIKGHSGYDSCERCQIHGVYKDNRVVLNSSEMCAPRTDEEFKEIRYVGHQFGSTPLLNAGVACISSFSLDYMHMVCLGVVKRLVLFLKKGPSECKLSAHMISLISDGLLSYAGKLPSEFARQPRSLNEIERWKATEFRQFLLYTGPVVLKNILSKEMYTHF